MTTITKFISLLVEQIGIDKKKELELLWKQLDTCPIILESGTRKNQVCGKLCKKDNIYPIVFFSLNMTYN